MRPALFVTGLFLAALCGGPSVPGAAAQDGVTTNGVTTNGVAITGEAALHTLFADQTFYGHTREDAAWTEYYWPDGRSSYEQDACVTAGEWRVSEKGACFAYPTFENGEVSCYLLFRNNGQIDFVTDEGGDPDAEFIAESIKPGNAERLPLTTTANCGD